MKWAYVCQCTVKIGSFVIHVLSASGNSQALRTALIIWKLQQTFSHCFLFQLSKLQLDSSSIMCGFLRFKASELLGLQEAGFCPQILSCSHWFHATAKKVRNGSKMPLVSPHTLASGYSIPPIILQLSRIHICFCSTQTQSIPFSSLHKVEVSEEPTKQTILSHMLRSTKSQHKKNHGSPAAFCCLVTIILFKFMTFTLFHNEHTI